MTFGSSNGVVKTGEAMKNMFERFQKRLHRDWEVFLQRWHGESDRRGMVLLMSVMMVTILSGLANAAVIQTSMDIREGGAYRIERAAFRMSESGTIAAVALAGEMQARFETYVANRGNKLGSTDTKTQVLDAKGKGSYDRETEALGTATYNTEVSPPELSTAVPGYDASKYCFRTFQLVTKAQFGDPSSSAKKDIAKAGEAGLQAFVTVGPTRCGN